MKVWEHDAVTAARQLIGYRLYVKEKDGSLTGGTIIETEAYTADDAASHSYNGRTTRNQVMFEPGGKLYVYFTYGMHWCVNIVTGQAGSGEAVLIRSLLIDKGLETVRVRRGYRSDPELTNGPAKLCQALDITGIDNGAILNKGRFMLLAPNEIKGSVTATKRIGIRKNIDVLWRFIQEQPKK